MQTLRKFEVISFNLIDFEFPTTKQRSVIYCSRGYAVLLYIWGKALLLLREEGKYSDVFWILANVWVSLHSGIQYVKILLAKERYQQEFRWSIFTVRWSNIIQGYYSAWVCSQKPALQTLVVDVIKWTIIGDGIYDKLLCDRPIALLQQVLLPYINCKCTHTLCWGPVQSADICLRGLSVRYSNRHWNFLTCYF